MAIADHKNPVDRFFAYARERHSIYLRRNSGAPGPWSDEPALHHYRFTNVFRELDKTTKWFSYNVRDRLRDKRAEVLLATVLFRMLNRIEVGEAMFCQRDLITGESGWDMYLGSKKIGAIRGAIRQYVGQRGPFVTGAYIISTPPGKPKLEGALSIVDNFRKSDVPGLVLDACSGQKQSLKTVFDLFKEVPYFGTFHSYEIVTDLRWTALLNKATDINTWANMGPGARRGLNRLHGRQRNDVDGRGKWGAKIPQEQAIKEMIHLLNMSRVQKYWPRGKDWPSWELREVEHTLCEFDKFERVRLGEGEPRGRFSWIG